ncbi:MAG: hypothetical protein QXI93_01955 [Candidatus Methanomethylicia archaeon]
MKGEAFLISSLILALIIIFFSIHAFTISPKTFESIDDEILYIHAINRFIDRYFIYTLQDYPLDSMHIELSFNLLKNMFLKFNSSLNVNDISFHRILTHTNYNSSRSNVVCFIEFSMGVGKTLFKRNLNYNLTLSISKCVFNGSSIFLYYDFYEDSMRISPRKAFVWLYFNGSWVKVDFKPFMDGLIFISWSMDAPSLILLDFVSFKGVRVCALYRFRD